MARGDLNLTVGREPVLVQLGGGGGGGGESPSTNASLVQLIFFSWCNIYLPKTDEDNNY